MADMETQKSYTYDLTIGTAQMDLCSRWRPSSLLESLQESASLNSNALGCGRQDLLRKNMVWVLIRIEVCMDAYPVLGDRVRVLTYPKPQRHGMYPRYFVLSDPQTGRVFGRASSLWTLLDLTTRRAVNAQWVADTILPNPELEPCLPLPGAVQELEAEPVCSIQVPQYAELDANSHVNNVRYLDWCCNTLGIPTMRESELAHFTVHYHHEIVPGQTIRTELRRDGMSFSFAGYEGETCHFAIQGGLREK